MAVASAWLSCQAAATLSLDRGGKLGVFRPRLAKPVEAGAGLVRYHPSGKGHSHNDCMTVTVTIYMSSLWVLRQGEALLRAREAFACSQPKRGTLAAWLRRSPAARALLRRLRLCARLDRRILLSCEMSRFSASRFGLDFGYQSFVESCSVLFLFLDQTSSA